MDESLREQLAKLAPQVDVDEALTGVHAQRASPRRFWPLAAAAVVMVVVGLGLLLMVARNDDRDGSVIAAEVPAETPANQPTPSPGVSPPPATYDLPSGLLAPPLGDDVRFDIEIQQLTLVDDGWSVVFNTAGGDLYGVDGNLDVWTEWGWQEFAPFTSCIEEWECEGELFGGGGPDIGLGAGMTEFLRLGNLGPGWYRVRKGPEQTAAGGIFAIEPVVDAPAATSPGSPIPDVAEAADAPVSIEVHRLEIVDDSWVVDFATQPTEVLQPDDRFGVAGTVEYWTGGAWEEIGWFASCLVGQCDGDLYPPEAGAAVDLRVVSPGEVETLRLDNIPVGPQVDGEPLEAGWYRLRKWSNQGVMAGGVFLLPVSVPSG